MCSSTGMTQPARRSSVRFRGGRRSRVLAPEAVQGPDAPPVLVVGPDPRAQRLVGDRRPSEPLQFLGQRAQLRPPELPPDEGVVVLGDVQVARVDPGKEQAPDPRQVPDHVAGRGEEHAVEACQPSRQRQLHRRAGNVTDVGLEAGVAADDLDLVAPAEDADRQHPRGVDQLEGGVHRHVADRPPPRRGLLPALDRSEVEIAVDPVRLRDNGFNAAHMASPRPRDGRSVPRVTRSRERAPPASAAGARSSP